jgi:hypothetical protein
VTVRHYGLSPTRTFPQNHGLAVYYGHRPGRARGQPGARTTHILSGRLLTASRSFATPPSGDAAGFCCSRPCRRMFRKNLLSDGVPGHPQAVTEANSRPGAGRRYRHGFADAYGTVRRAMPAMLTRMTGCRFRMRSLAERNHLRKCSRLMPRSFAAHTRKRRRSCAL